MVALQDAALVINTFDAMMADAHPTEGWRARASADGTDFGNPEATISAIASQLADGDLESLDRYGNREAKFYIAFDAPDAEDPGAAIALGQAALEAALRFKGWAPLSWTSPLAGAEVSVTEMTSATVSKEFDDLREMRAGWRVISVTVHARPFVRATDVVTIDAPSIIGSTTTTVDDGSSATGWSMVETAPAPMHNVNSNPSFEVNTTGWLIGSGTTSISRGNGSLSGKVGTYFAIVDPVDGATRSYINSPLMTVTAGTTYTVMLTIWWGHSAGCMVRWYSDTAGNVQVGVDDSVSLTPNAQRSFARKAPVGAVRMRIFPYANSAAGGFIGSGTLSVSDTWSVDAVAVVDAAAGIPGYFDGATTDLAGITYNWDTPASPGNSTSTASWTAPSLAASLGKVQATVYGRSTATARRTGAITMSSLNYIRVRGVASWDTASPKYAGLTVSLADNGGGAVPAISSTIDGAGNFDVIVKRPEGFTKLDVTAKAADATAPLKGVRVAVDSVVITDNPFFTGAVQSRQVPIYGSQRTELSLAILGLSADGTSPVALGEQVLVHTATAGEDSRLKFLGCRAASSAAGTADTTATTGSYNTLSTTSSPTTFAFAAASLLPGQYVSYVRLQGTAAATRTLSYAAALDGAGSLDASDPATGWHTSQVAVATAWRIVPLGYLMLPPANIEDPGATLTVKIAADVASVVRVDEIWLAHVESGQVTLLDTNDSGISAVRLDAATVEASEPSAWVGVATGSGTGTMMAAGTRIQAFDQHLAEPGLLQISTVTPGCATSRVSASYFPRYAHDVAPLPAP